VVRKVRSPITLSGNVYYRPDISFTEDKRAHIQLCGLIEQSDLREGEKILDSFSMVIGEGKTDSVTQIMVPFKVGDVAIYPKSDFLGRFSVAGGHTNFGYSGYFRASIFDGRAWSNFKIWNFISEEDRSYKVQYKLNETKDRVMKRIIEKRGFVAVYNDRTYEISNSE
jgi:hypothetical protein